MASCARVRRELREAQANGSHTVVLDLAGLDFMDSTAVQLLLEVTVKTGYGPACRVLLRRGPESVQRLLRVAGVENRLPFVN